MKKLVIGLRTATQEEITLLKKKYPQGHHRTHKKTGEKLPYNGVFYTHRK